MLKEIVCSFIYFRNFYASILKTLYKNLYFNRGYWEWWNLRVFEILFEKLFRNCQMKNKMEKLLIYDITTTMIISNHQIRRWNIVFRIIYLKIVERNITRYCEQIKIVVNRRIRKIYNRKLYTEHLGKWCLHINVNNIFHDTNNRILRDIWIILHRVTKEKRDKLLIRSNIDIVFV